MRAREIAHTKKEDNRFVRPFAWGAEFISDHVNGDDPRLVFRRHTERVMEDSDKFFACPEINGWRLDGDHLTWPSAIETSAAVNNTVHARLFTLRRERRNKPRAGVVVLPQWNAQPDSHVEACRIFNGLGMTALRVTLPYHEERRPPELERAEHLVSSNIGRTIQSMRQAVLDTRAAVRWLRQQGIERIGILGTSIGSCTAFLAFAHDPEINVGIFMSGCTPPGTSLAPVGGGADGSIGSDETGNEVVALPTLYTGLKGAF